MLFFFFFWPLSLAGLIRLIIFRDELILTVELGCSFTRERVIGVKSQHLHLHGCLPWPNNQRTVPRVHSAGLGVCFCLYERVSRRFLCDGVIISCILEKRMTL